MGINGNKWQKGFILTAANISRTANAILQISECCVSLFIGQYSAVPPPQATQTKKGLAKAPAKKAESSDSSDSSDEAEQAPPKGRAGMLCGGKAADEVLYA